MFICRGNNVMQLWADNLPMQKKDRGRLDSKIDLLERAKDNFLPGLLHRTRCKHIMHLVVNGKVALRPLLCRGPFVQNEFTFLYGTTEKDRKFVQKDAPERAEWNRADLVCNPTRRCKHVRFSTDPQEGIQE
jgi:hypothetical protein